MFAYDFILPTVGANPSSTTEPTGTRTSYFSPTAHSGLVYFSGISTPERCGDMWGFGVHPILSNPLKYSTMM
jgi:hypothetical protein